MNQGQPERAHMSVVTQCSALATLYQDAADARQFWSQLLEETRRLAEAEHVVLLERQSGAPWQASLVVRTAATSTPLDASRAMRVADAAVQAGNCQSELIDALLWLAVPMARGARGQSADRDAVMVLARPPLDADATNWLTHWLQLLAQLPQHQHNHGQLHAMGPGQQDAQRLYDIVRLGLRCSESEHFMAAAFALCNELLVRMRASHVMLGWVRHGVVELRAISQIEKFDAKSQASRHMVEAMEEVVDQDVAVTHPGAPSARAVNRAHVEYARAQAVDSLSSVPIRWKGEVLGVLSVERSAQALSEGELWELDLITQVCAQQLLRLEREGRWWGRRAWDALLGFGAMWLEPKHIAWKLLGVGVVAAVAIAALLPWTYRIEAGARLSSKDLLFIPAPFDGYLSRVHVDIGDAVRKGELLVALDPRDLQQEVRMASADVARYRGEAERAQAQQDFAEMQIARALEQQAQAKLTLVQYQLDNAQVHAPMDATVIEGELKKNLGSPVRKGDLLMKLAQNRDIYLELDVDQSDIQDMAVGMQGEVAFVGRPEERFAFSVERIDPVAVSRDGRNVFVARAQVDVQASWRPGMGGTAKLDAGEHSLLWVLTRRTVRYLREVLWL